MFVFQTHPQLNLQVLILSLISYKKYVDHAHIYQIIATAKDSDIDPIKSVNKVAKQKYTALYSAFTGGDNAFGSRVLPSCQDMMQELYFPHGKQRKTAKQLTATMPESRLHEA